MTKHKGQDTVVDPNERVVMPRNSSQSYAKGGGVMRHALKDAGQHMDISGGCKNPGERSLEQYARDVERGGKSRR